MPPSVIHIYMGNYLGHVVTETTTSCHSMCSFFLDNYIGHFLFGSWDFKVYINWLWKLNPLWEWFSAVKSETPPIFIHTLMKIQALFLATVACFSSTLVQSYGKRQQGS